MKLSHPNRTIWEFEINAKFYDLSMCLAHLFRLFEIKRNKSTARAQAQYNPNRCFYLTFMALANADAYTS